MKKILTLVLVSALGGALTILGYKTFVEEDQIIIQEQIQPTPRFIPAVYTPTSNSFNTIEAPDFVEAAEETINTVVHVKNTAKPSQYSSYFDFFSSRRSQPVIGSGSGVIISPDGYIITNNHVIDNAESIDITTNDNKIYIAELIGTDKETDIALLKVDTDEDLPYTTFADSDNAKIGEWVLAVGNPFNLTSTVTAGIISAKSRDLDDRGNRRQSFIQTDAAVNPGNSGGALVNTNGDLIGINTAITSQTGSYVGYSFAVPSNIAKKIVEDILEYGDVQNGSLGVEGSALSGENAKEFDTNITEGFFVRGITPDSGAEKAGVKEGDIIIKLDNVSITKFSDLRGYLTAKRPGNIVDVTVIRDGENKVIPVTLTKSETITANFLNMDLTNISKEVKEKYNIKNGVTISNISNRALEVNFGIRSDYILTSINDIPLESVEDIHKFKNKYGEDFRNHIVKIEVANSKGQEKREIVFQ